MKRTLTLLVVCLFALVLAGCGDDNAAKVKEKADPTSSVVETDDADATDEEPSDEEASEEPSDEPEAESASLGDLVTVGDWDVRVTRVQVNANSAIEATNEFNDRPKGQYVLVTYEATYTGSERSADVTSDLTWSFTTTDAQVNDVSATVTPADTDDWPTEARKGGKVRGQVVFDLPSSKIKGGTLTVEGYDDEYDTVYADFKVT